MTRDEVIRLALKAGFTWEPINNIAGPLESFAALVASAEREACAEVSESFKEEGMEWRWDCVPGEEIAAAIRARRKK